MDIIRLAIKKPVAVAVGVILVVMFGLIGLDSLPVQLTPDVEKPQITVSTIWPGASPYEVEKDVIEKQEKALKGLRGLEKLESASYNSYGEVTLTFELATDLDNALLRVSNKMNEVSRYPENVEKPVIEAAGAQSSPVIWMMLKTAEGNPESIDHFRTFFENNVRQHLERVPGVGSLLVFGGTDDQLDVTLKPAAMARYRVTINDLIRAIRAANVNVSAGVLGIGRKNYRIRTKSRFNTGDDLGRVVIRDDGFRRVYLADVASVGRGFARKDVSVQQNGVNVIVVGVRRAQGANVLKMTDRMAETVESLNQGILKENKLYIDWVYDQRPYINRAIDLVKGNIAIGGLLAVCVLLLFLRSFRATLTTAVAIPISAVGTFIFLWLMGRNLNVVSLAGISFAVGMLVDNSIVVLENIDRHRKEGEKTLTAVYEGAREVWGAVFASTATTVAVFLPVIFIREEAGQLFRDIAIAITFSIILSMLVSITVIPTLMNLLYRKDQGTRGGRFQKSRVGPWFSALIMKTLDLCIGTIPARFATIIILTSLSLAATWWLMPPAEYLPQGNRNLILNILIPPPGYSVNKMEEMGKMIFARVKPYMEEDGKDGIPRIRDMFYVGADRFHLFGGIAEDDTRAREMMPLFNRIMGSIPGIFGVSIQAGIFESNIGGGRTVEVNVSGEKIEAIVAAARTLFGAISGGIKGSRVRPVPSLETSYPEANIVPDKEKLAAGGMSEKDLGTYVDILMDGRRIDSYRPEGVKEIDLVLKGDVARYDTPEKVMESPLVTGRGDLVRVGDLGRLVYSQGMPQINHLERDRTITLEVTPPRNLPLQSAMESIEKGIIPELAKAGKLAGVKVAVGGNADKLKDTGEAMQWNLLLALAITYLLMAALFENFFYPLVIMFSVPLAAAGGFAGLAAVNAFIYPQGFDVLTMLGFIILIGTVVNNAILIVHQSLNNVRYQGMVGLAAIIESVRTRIRPIFMSAATSLFGMLPLVLSTGSGSELYRGLGSILLGGLAASTVFTLFVIPAILAFFIGRERSRSNESL